MTDRSDEQIDNDDENNDSEMETKLSEPKTEIVETNEILTTEMNNTNIAEFTISDEDATNQRNLASKTDNDESNQISEDENTNITNEIDIEKIGDDHDGENLNEITEINEKEYNDEANREDDLKIDEDGHQEVDEGTYREEDEDTHRGEDDDTHRGEDEDVHQGEDEEDVPRREEDEEDVHRKEEDEEDVHRKEEDEEEVHRKEEDEEDVHRKEEDEEDVHRREEDEENVHRGEEEETNQEEEVHKEEDVHQAEEEYPKGEAEDVTHPHEEGEVEEDAKVTSKSPNIHAEEEGIDNVEDTKSRSDKEETLGEGVHKGNQIDDGEETQENVIKEAKTEQKIADRPKVNIDGISNFFTAAVQLDDGSIKNRLVTIVRSKAKKPFLGGYRHKVSGIVYHHAANQTMPKPRPPPKVEIFSRDTQTFQLKHQKLNTNNTTSTQMTAPGIFVANVTDRLMAPKPYETADDYQARILQNIIIIQKYYRRWLARQIVDDKRKQRDDRFQWEESEKERKIKEKEERIKNEYQRRMHPKTKADFDLLYNDLEKWREEQLAEIDNCEISEAERKARKALLLEEETDLLAAIDRHKLDRKEEMKTEAVQKMLNKAAAPKTWKDSKGRKIEMNTQFTIRSKELLEIFNSLNMQYLTPDERLDVLLTLKHTVKEHDCKLTKDIVELVDREADLIMRNMKEASLAGLRKRISTLFLQYCKTPTFNPQISSLLKVPSDTSVLVGDINYCKYCGRYLRSTEFSLSTKSSKLTICKSCARKDNQSRNRQDYSHYRRILKEIQMNEQEIDDGSKIAFIFKQNDVKSLIESVWDGKSILSGCDDLDELIFMRWDYRCHWSPWNTIFLTKDEAEAHIKVTELSETYSAVLINRIVQKHVIAKNMFGSLEKMIGDLQTQAAKVPITV